MRAATVLRSVIYRTLAIVLAALAVLSSIAPVQAFADDSSQPVKTVRVGWLVNNEGFQDGTPGERLSGWGYEHLQTLSYYTPGWRYEYVSGTFTELMDMLEAGEIDLMPNISYSEERAQKLLFSSNPEGTERYYIYAKPDRDDLTKGDPQALQGLTIGYNPDVMQTFVGQQWLANEGITCTYREYDGGSMLFDALANDEVDAVIMNDTISSPDASPMFYVGSSDYYFAVPKSRPDLMDDINAAMSAIARVNPRYIDEVKSNYSAQNSGSSSLNGPERSWLKANDNTITFGYITGKLPYCNEDEDGKMEGSLASLATTLHDKFGITVKTVAFDSYKMMSKALSKGSIDAALPVYRVLLVCRAIWRCAVGIVGNRVPHRHPHRRQPEQRPSEHRLHQIIVYQPKCTRKSVPHSDRDRIPIRRRSVRRPQEGNGTLHRRSQFTCKNHRRPL